MSSPPFKAEPACICTRGILAPIIIARVVLAADVVPGSCMVRGIHTVQPAYTEKLRILADSSVT